MEPRSFMAEASVGEVTKVDLAGLTLDEKISALFTQGIQVHGCLEQHIAETRLAELSAAEARERLAGKVDAVTDAVGALETRVDITEGSVSALAKAHGATLPLGAKPMKVKADMSWKDIGKIAGTVLGGFGGFVLFLQVAGPPIGRFFVDLWASILAANAS